MTFFSRVRERLRCDRGQALVEFALALPLIVTVVFAGIDFGNAYNYKDEMTSLANTADRFGVVATCAPCSSASETIEQYVKTTAPGALQNGGSGVGIQSPGVSISFCLPNGTWGVGQPLQATVTAVYSYLPYDIRTLGVPSTVTITGTATEAIEATTYSAGTFSNAPAHC